MFSFLIRKMLKNRWMTLSLLLGNILLIGIVSAIPVYSEATMQKMLFKQADTFTAEKGVYPGLLSFQNRQNVMRDGQNFRDVEAMRTLTTTTLPEDFNLPVLSWRESFTISNARFRLDHPGEEQVLLGEITGLSGFAENTEIVLGRPAATAMTDGILEAVVSKATYDELHLLLEDTYVCANYSIGGQPLRLKITGVFDSADQNEYYWTKAPGAYSKTLFVDEGLLLTSVLNNIEQNYSAEVQWQLVLDCSALQVRHVNRYLAAAAALTDSANTVTAPYNVVEYFSTILSGYNGESQKLTLTLWVLQVPMFIMLALFIYMVSKQILSIDRGDISVLKSRGASRARIISLYFFQGLIISAISGGLGLGLGVLICKITGASSGFLNLVERSSLPINLNNPTLYGYMAIATAVSMLTMLIPVVGYSKVTIVDMKREKSTRAKSLWQTFYLDIVALLIAGYGLYSFNSQKDLLAASDSARQAIDPLMFLTSSLFVIGLSLLSLRLFPWLVRGIFRLFRATFSPALYASFLRVIRSVGEEQFIMIFLIFTLATGIFNAKIARTINLNVEDRIRHGVGTDLRIQEIWINAHSGEEGDTSSSFYYEPDFSRYTAFPEVTAATKVVNEPGEINTSTGRINVTLMGIITDEFGRIAWHREDLFPTHFYNYLNTLSRDPQAVLVSSNLKDRYKIGDVITYRTRDNIARGIIYGFVDYWPGFVGYQQVRGSNDRLQEEQLNLVVANLGYLQAQWGVTPYEVWMKTNSTSNNFLALDAIENNIRYRTFADAKADIIASRNTPVLQGTNGVLTVDFIITLAICAVGFLIYWVLSIKSRVLQFGVFRAMGLSFRGVLSILINEQVLISGISILLGVAIGEISSELFVPIIQVAYSASEKIIPIKIVMEAGDYARLFSVVGGMMLGCLVVLGVLVSRIKIAQALKLGED